MPVEYTGFLLDAVRLLRPQPRARRAARAKASTATRDARPRHQRRRHRVGRSARARGRARRCGLRRRRSSRPIATAVASAPRSASCTPTSISTSRRSRCPGCEDITAYAIDGPPGLCVCAGRLGAFGDPPDIVVSGVNPGLQHRVGRSCTREPSAPRSPRRASAARRSRSASPSPTRTASTPRRAVALDVLPMLLDAPLAACSISTFPRSTYDDVLGVRWARLAAFGSVRAAIAESERGRSAVRTARHGCRRTARLRPGARRRRASRRSPPSSALPRRGRREITASAEVSSAVVPGAGVDVVHAVPDASAPRSLHRPLHATAIPADE